MDTLVSSRAGSGSWSSATLPSSYMSDYLSPVPPLSPLLLLTHVLPEEFLPVMSASAGHGAHNATANSDLTSSDPDQLLRTTKKKQKEHVHTGFTAATMRALSARMLTFYFRAPIKAFFRPRIESVA